MVYEKRGVCCGGLFSGNSGWTRRTLPTPSPYNVLFACLAIDAHIAFQFALHGSCVVESAKMCFCFSGKYRFQIRITPHALPRYKKPNADFDWRTEKAESEKKEGLKQKKVEMYPDSCNLIRFLGRARAAK